MLNTSCLVCDRQEGTHNVFYDVITGGTGSSERVSLQLRRRLEGVLAVSLTLEKRAPHRLCTGCEGHLCDIENRVRNFRDYHSATTERYAQRRRAPTGPSFHDLNGDRVMRCERGSETGPETETQRRQSFRPIDSTSQWADSPQSRPGKDVVWTPRISRPALKGSGGLVHVAGGNRLTSTGMTLGGNLNSESRVPRIDHRASMDETKDSERCADDARSASAPGCPNQQAGVENQRTTSTSGDMVQVRYDIDAQQRQDSVNCAEPTDYEQDLVGEKGNSIETADSNEHATSQLNSDSLLVKDTKESGLNLACHNRNSISGRSNIETDKSGQSQNTDRGQNTGEKAQIVNGTLVESQPDERYQLSKYEMEQKGCSSSDNQCARDSHAENLDFTERNYTKTEGDGALDLSQTQKDQFCISQSQEDEAVLDLTLRRNPTPETTATENHQHRQTFAVSDQSYQNKEKIASDHLQRETSPPRPGMDYSATPQQQQANKVSALESGQDDSSREKRHIDVDDTARKNGEWVNRESSRNSQSGVRSQLGAPPPLIHVSEVKQEPVETENAPAPSMLGYIQKMPIMIAPIDDSNTTGSYHQQVINNVYDEGFHEPPLKRRRHYPKQAGASSQFPVLNTHVSATLNVTNPPKEYSTLNGQEAMYNKNMEANAEKIPAQAGMQTTTMIQGTLRIPLHQLRRGQKTPADISLVTEATVHTMPSPNCEPSRQSEVCSTKIPLNIAFNPKTCSLKIPISQQLLNRQPEAVMMSQANPNWPYSYSFPASNPGHPNKAAFSNGHAFGDHPEKPKGISPRAPINPQGPIVTSYNPELRPILSQPQKSPGQNNGALGQPMDGPTHPGQNQPSRMQQYPSTGQMVSYGWPNQQMKNSGSSVYASGHTAYLPTIPQPVAMMQPSGNLPHGQLPPDHHPENMDWQQDKENELDSEEEGDEEESTSPDAERIVVVAGNKTDCNGRRQLLRPWLEERLNKGNVPGFQWYDKEQNLFKIPWKHRSKNDWRPDNCTIFMEWAIHTGKHRVGIDKPDYCRWKTRLRCAFNQAADIRERKDLKRMKVGEPYKVYEFLPRSEVRPKSQAKPKTDTALPPSMSTQSEALGQANPKFPVSQPSLSECMLNSALQRSPPSIPTGGTRIPALPNHSTGNHFEASPQKLHTIQPPTQPSVTPSPIVVKVTPGSPIVMAASVPVETNNNKFSWDPDLEDRPLVIDLGPNEDEEKKSSDPEDSQEQKGYPEGKVKGTVPTSQNIIEVLQQSLQSGNKPYLCDLCGRCFASLSALENHNETHHKSLTSPDQVIKPAQHNTKHSPCVTNMNCGLEDTARQSSPKTGASVSTHDKNNYYQPPIRKEDAKALSDNDKKDKCLAKIGPLVAI